MTWAVFLMLWEYASYTAAHGTPMLEGRLLSSFVSNKNSQPNEK